MVISNDIVQITLYWFFFTMGGILGFYTNLLFILPMGLLLAVLATWVRYYFIKKVEHEEIFE